MKRYDLTVAITAHNEGLVAHKTMRSILEATKRLEEKNISFEILVHIDNGNQETLDYFDAYKNNSNILIFKNKFGDLGSSRNFLVQKASGEYISFLDADDLVSDNWLLLAYQTIKESPFEIVVHPEAVLNFGLNVPSVLTIQKDSRDKNNDTVIMIGENRWCSVVMGKKETFLRVPYHKLGDGYGYEDYIFNAETLKLKISHKIAKETVLFYRRSGSSMLSTNNLNSFIIPHVGLFDIESLQAAFPKNTKSDIKTPLKTRGYALYKKIRNNNFLNFFITPPAKLTLKLLGKYEKLNTINSLPDFLYEHWIKINQIDTQLYPYKDLIKNTSIYKPEMHIAIGKTFIDITSRIKNYNPNYIFIVPWIVRGGGDKVLLNTIKALKEIHPTWTFSVISTLPSDNIWAKRLPEYVDFIDFGNSKDSLTDYESDILFSRLVTQLNCKNLHIINSEFAYLWAIRHKILLQKKYNLTASVFNTVFIEGSKNRGRFTYVNPYIFMLRDTLKKVYTDNQTVVDECIDEHALNPVLFKVHYQPIEEQIIQPKINNEDKLRILWAGRITSVKLPNILKSIGENLSKKDFSIDIYGEFSRDIKHDYFDNVETITYRGTFDGFNNIPTNKYDILLYTSEADGVPNIILEATAAGLPVIASNDGGVHEFIKDQKTGILIDDPCDVKKYVESLNKIQKDKTVLIDYVRNAQELLKKRHSFNSFVKEIKNDFKGI